MVHSSRGEFGALRHRAKAYTLLVSDSVRVQNRIKSLFQSRGVAVAGKGVFRAAERDACLKKLPATARPLAEFLVQEQDGLLRLRRKSGQVASIMLAVWRNEEVYDPARVGEAGSRIATAAIPPRPAGPISRAAPPLRPAWPRSRRRRSR